MEATAIAEVAALLIAARRSGTLLAALPDTCRPATVDDAHAIQLAMAAALGESIAGWKVATTPEGRVARGGLLASRVVASGATLSSAQMPLLGVEAEIAFRFDRALPARQAPYGYDDVAAVVTALPAIEVVDSRFHTYPKTPLLDRLADFMSNGALVHGETIRRWREIDLANVEVELAIDGMTVVRQMGGHPSKDPLLPALALANDLRAQGIPAGWVVTTGSYTGLNYAKPGQAVEVTFRGAGAVSLHFDRSKET